MATAAKKSEGSTAQAPRIRIKIRSFDYRIIDQAVKVIIDSAANTGAVVHGPIPLPTRIEKMTVNRSTFVKKDARDQFEMRTHRRLIDISNSNSKTIDSLTNLSLPSGIDIEIKMI